MSTRTTMRPRRLALALAVSSLLPLSAQAATFTVTTLADEFFDGPETVGAPDGTGLSLREAIGLANAAAGDDVIQFDGGLANGTINLSSIEMVVSSVLTITGGAQTLDALNATRHLRVAAGGNLLISNLTFTNGNAGTNTDGSSDGGAILVDAGAQLNANTLTFTGNDGFSGGAVDMNTGSTVTIANSTFSGNTALRAGGAIEHAGGAGSVLTLSLVTGTGNTTGPGPTPPGNGGFLHVTGAGNTNVIGGTFSNNTAATEGGAFWNDTGVMDLGGNMTITANTASGPAADDGGGGVFQRPGGTTTIAAGVSITNNIANGAAGSGGGILNLGTVIASGTTITGNRSNRAGGGIESAAGSTTNLTNVTLTGNNTGVAPAVAAPGNGGGFHITGNGNATISGGSISNNVAALEGGGVWNGTGTMTIQNGTVINANTASGNALDDGGGGVFQTLGGGTIVITAGVQITNNIANGTAGSGGGVFNLGGTVNITGATISGNRSNRAGGGIEAAAGTTTTLTDVTLTNNNTGVAPAVGSPGNGGGFHITGNGNATISGGTISNNVAALEGGGVWNGTGTMTIQGGTLITANTASGPAADDGGGGVFQTAGGGTTNILAGVQITNNIANGTAGSGGGILNLSTVNVTGASITGNRSNRAGGGIESAAGTTTTLTNVTLTGNNTGVAPAVGSPGNGGGFHITGNGNATISGGTISNNVAALEGGGVWNGTGTMTIQSGTVINANTASGPAADDGGGGVFQTAGGGTTNILAGVQITNNIANGAAGSGGGILNLSIVNVTGATITGNRSNRAGGGIESAAGTTTTLTDVTLNSNNTGVAPAVAAPGNGGGFHITGNGNATITGGTVNNNQAALEGGGLWNGSGQMTVTGTTISGNTAVGAGADDGGGGLFNNGGTLTVNTSTVSNNTAPGTSGSGGGYLNNVGGTLVVNGGSITGNSAARAGGGIEDNAGARVTLSNVTVSGNTTGNNPGNGGGLHITGAGTVVVNTSTFSGNNAANEGGGLWNSGAGSMTLNTSTVSGNSSPAGGGVFKDGTGGTTALNSSTIAFNTGTGLTSEGGAFTLANTVISDNTAGACANTGGSSYTSTGFNLISTVVGCTIAPQATDLTGRSAQLGGLANNGGSTLTHLPGLTSPLLDAGSCAAGNDQRGTARPIDLAGFTNAANGCDIGAVEATSGSPPFIPPEVIPTLDWRGLLLALALVGLIGGLALRRVGSH